MERSTPNTNTRQQTATTAPEGLDSSQDTKKSGKQGAHSVNSDTNTKQQVGNLDADSSNNKDLDRRTITSEQKENNLSVKDNKTTTDSTGGTIEEIDTDFDLDFDLDFDFNKNFSISDNNTLIFSKKDTFTNEQPLPKISPKMMSTVKKHSCFWVLFQKLKRFVHTASMHKDSRNITSKDTKPIPEEMIKSITHFNNISGLNKDGDKTTPLLNQYNAACIKLQSIETRIPQDKEKNDEGDLETYEQEKEKAQNELLLLSKSIVEYTDQQIKNSASIIKKCYIDTSEKEHTNFLEVLKSHIAFDANKVVIKGGRMA